MPVLTAIASFESPRPVPIEFPDALSAWADFSRPVISVETNRLAEWDKAIRIMHAMLSLGDDWDGMGAKAPAWDIVFSAIELAYSLRSYRDYPAPTRATATPAGTIGLEWQIPSVYTEVEVVATGGFDWMVIKDGEQPKHWTGDRIPDPDFPPCGAPTLDLTFEHDSRPVQVVSPFRA
jgi:hypothetical protein